MYIPPRDSSQWEKPEDCPDFPSPDPYGCNCRFSVECWEGWYDDYYFECYPEEREQWGRSYQYLEYPKRGWPVEKVRSFMQIHNIMLRFWKDVEQMIIDDYF